MFNSNKCLILRPQLKRMSTDKKQNIIDTAITLFAKKGFEGTSIRDLAAAAGVNVAMINYYFGSKEKLFESLLEYKASYTRDVLGELEKDKTLSCIEKIDRLIEMQVNKLFSNRHFHKVLHHELTLNQREDLGIAIVHIFSENVKIVMSIIEAGMKKKEFKKVDPALTVASLYGTINQIVLSKRMCCMLLQKEQGFDPYSDEKFKQKVIEHLKQLMHAHLLK